MAVVTHAGLFDTSHMAVVRVPGRARSTCCSGASRATCTRAWARTTRRSRRASASTARSSTSTATPSTTASSTRSRTRSTWSWSTRAWAARSPRTWRRTRRRRTWTSAMTDLTDKLGKIDIQGPAAIKIMQKVLKTPEQVFDKLHLLLVQGPLRSGVGVRRRRAAARRHAAAAVAVGLHGRSRVRDLRGARAHREGVEPADGRGQGVSASSRAAWRRATRCARAPCCRSRTRTSATGRTSITRGRSRCPSTPAGDGFTKAFLGSAALEQGGRRARTR